MFGIIICSIIIIFLIILLIGAVQKSNQESWVGFSFIAIIFFLALIIYQTNNLISEAYQNGIKDYKLEQLNEK